MNDVQLHLSWDGSGNLYNEKIFAFVWEGHIVEENISQERLFEIVENLYEPESTNFSFQVWTGKWETILLFCNKENKK